MTSQSVVIIDMRPLNQYEEGHLEGSHSFPWPIPKSDLCRLPPRERNLHILAEPHHHRHIEELFARLGYENLLFLPLSGWDPAKVTLEAPTETPWSPNPFLAERVQELEDILGGPGIAVDVGSGTGRDVVYLALRGWLVFGLESREKLIREGSSLSKVHRVDCRAASIQVNVSHGLPIRRGSVSFISVSRFIHRKSFAQLIELLKPGGLLLYSHFLEGCEKTPVGRPRDARGFFLKGELEQMVLDQRCTILYVRQSTLPDTRPMIHMIARKPSL